jgi:hypothetical protein
MASAERRLDEIERKLGRMMEELRTPCSPPWPPGVAFQLAVELQRRGCSRPMAATNKSLARSNKPRHVSDARSGYRAEGPRNRALDGAHFPNANRKRNDQRHLFELQGANARGQLPLAVGSH